MKYSNCLIWAITQFLRHGGYISCRKGRHFGGWYLHFLWAKELSGPWFSYSVDYEKSFPWPLFTGNVIEGDAEDKPQN